MRFPVTRDGTHVTGSAHFPYAVCGRDQCPIDYHVRSADGSIEPDIDPKTQSRLDVVQRYRHLLETNQGTAKHKIAERVARESAIRVSVRSVQLWDQKFEIEGVDGLRDKYTARPSRIATLPEDIEQRALFISVWWAFRIGNCCRIDTAMILTSAKLVREATTIADIIATIDCYYSHECDRQRYPFKPFARWAKYDFTKWLYRAADQADYRRQAAKVREGHVPLQSPATIRQPIVTDQKTRSRDANNHRTRRNIQKLSGVNGSSRTGKPSTDDAKHFADAKKLEAMGAKPAARKMRSKIDTGVPAMAACNEPKTIADSLGLLDDTYRVMLIKAAQGERYARNEASATLPLWWETMPQTIRNNIDFRVDHWRKTFPRATDHDADRRRLYMLLPEIRRRGCGANQLAVAARLPS